MAPHIVRLAWEHIDGNPTRLSIDDLRTYKVPMRPEYVALLPEEVRDYINPRIEGYTYPARVDRHVYVDGEFVMGIECKTYAENTMLKRILIDFRLLKSAFPHLVCCLLQLESMLGGDYSQPLADTHYGSTSSHTLMSFLPDVDLNIVTLLEGERRVDQPIHQEEHFKELTPEILEHAIERFSQLLAAYV